MALLAVVLILIVWAIIGIKEALTPSLPPIEDMTEHTNIILSLPNEKARRKYLKELSKEARRHKK